MAHELSILTDGTVEMAFLQSEGTCWHNLGNPVADNQPTDSWLQAANMGNWKINEATTLFYDEGTDEVYSYGDKKVLYRSDDKRPLASVGVNYKVVQPAEVVTFFQDIIESLGFEMSTCGVLFGGKRFWAQANIGQSVNLLGQDRVDGKLLLSTSCDGSLATSARYTTVRTVCNNTLNMALQGKADQIKVNHSSTFDANAVKTALGLQGGELNEWSYAASQLVAHKITNADAMDFFGKVFDLYEEDMTKEDRLQIAADTRSTATVYDLFTGKGIGSDLVTAKGTLWGALNAVTQYADHDRKTRTMGSRMDSAWFGGMSKMKDTAWDEAVLMIA